MSLICWTTWLLMLITRTGTSIQVFENRYSRMRFDSNLFPGVDFNTQGHEGFFNTLSFPSNMHAKGIAFATPRVGNSEHVTHVSANKSDIAPLIPNGQECHSREQHSAHQ